MFASTLLLVVSAVSSCSAVQFTPRSSENDTLASRDATPKRYIVELLSRDDGSHVTSSISEAPGLHVVRQFDSEIFPAVSIDCDDCNLDSLRSTIDALLGRSVVASVYQSSPIRLLPTIEGESFSDDAEASNYSVHGLTGVDKLHQAGIYGEGATVAIVDSGVQYTHPALGGGFGPGFTVIGGYDLVGETWPRTDPQPDSDPMDHYGHGTHVAGIVAGNSTQFVGVAPKAKLISMKVFGSTGYSNEETVIEGFLRAFESGADIISASLGEVSGFTTNAWAVLASRMVEQGVVVVIAAGNDGENGPFSASNGASGKDVLTIASAEPGEFPAQVFSVSFIDNGSVNKTPVAYLPTSNFPSTVVDWPVVPLSLNSSVESDACTTLSNTTSFNNTIALIRLGGCTITTKQKNVAASGASYILFYNTDAALQYPASLGASGYAGVIEARAGEAIIDQLLDGGNVTASFNLNTTDYVGIYNSGGGFPASYSSWGGTYELALKPDVAAPGTKILSTYPTDSYKVLSGTSMATPYMAGIAALWVSKFGGRAAHANDPAWAKRLIARMTSTSRSMPWSDWNTSGKDYGFWAPPTQVGGGLVDAGSIIGYTTEVGFDGRKIELNDTANFVGEHSFDLTNNGDAAVTYDFEVQEAGGYDAYIPVVPGTTEFAVPRLRGNYELPPGKISPQVTLPQSITVGPGETKRAEISFTPPVGVNETNLPVYGGKVLIHASNGEELSIPYFGVASSLKETIPIVWNTGYSYPYMRSGINSVGIAQKSNFTFNLTRNSQDFPSLYTRFIWGTKELRWDVFSANYTEADWTYPPVVGQNGFVGSATSWNGTGNSLYFDPTVNSVDDLYSFPLYDRPRDVTIASYWLGRFANGSTVVPGVYNFRVAALRPFGDPTEAGDWNLFQTPTITVLSSPFTE